MLNRVVLICIGAVMVLSVVGGEAFAQTATAPETIRALQDTGRLGVQLKRGADVLSVTSTGRAAHKTGRFPMMGDSDGDGRPDNPNSIRTRNCTWSIPLKPRKASSPGRLGRGPIAISITGIPFFNKQTHLGGDAVKSEVFDGCKGHPDQQGTYHYHQQSPCMGEAAGVDGHAGLIGWSPDGYGIYGRGATGGLDRCNGHADANRDYHYHASQGAPYVLGCYRGVVASARPRCEGGDQRRGPEFDPRRGPPPFGRPPPPRR